MWYQIISEISTLQSTYFIAGREEQVEAARKQLEAAVAEISNVSEGEMSVAARHHRHFVARRGEVLRRIADDCGGVQISFPRQGVNSDRVVLKGPKDCIEAAKARINEIIEDLEAKVSLGYKRISIWVGVWEMSLARRVVTSYSGRLRRREDFPAKVIALVIKPLATQ